jgi:protein-L-isoaspartate(D-aspartate) O-methyltransferase
VTLKDEHGAALSSSSQPGIMAQMLEHLHLMPGLQVLEIGAGTGYNAALLGELVGPHGRVVTLDVDATVAARARQQLASGGHRAEVVVGDGIEGWRAAAPFDRIVTATPPLIPKAWLEQLRPGGLLEVPMMLGRGAKGL